MNANKPEALKDFPFLPGDGFMDQALFPSASTRVYLRSNFFA